MAKAIIYVPWMLVDAFKLDAEEHELEMKFLQNDLAGNAVFEAEGNELENPEWMKELEKVKIEVSVYVGVTAKGARHLRRITDVITDIKSGGRYEVFKSIFLL